MGFYSILFYIHYRPARPAVKGEFDLDLRAIEGAETVITAQMPKLKTVDSNDIDEAANASIPENV